MRHTETRLRWQQPPARTFARLAKLDVERTFNWLVAVMMLGMAVTAVTGSLTVFKVAWLFGAAGFGVCLVGLVIEAAKALQGRKGLL